MKESIDKKLEKLIDAMISETQGFCDSVKESLEKIAEIEKALEEILYTTWEHYVLCFAILFYRVVYRFTKLWRVNRASYRPSEKYSQNTVIRSDLHTRRILYELF